MSKKPNKVITIIHTGKGDDGYCTINGTLVSKSDVIIRYLSGLDKCQSYTHSLNSAKTNVQDFLFILGALVNNPNSEKYTIAANKLYQYFKKEINSIVRGLPALTGFIRTSTRNSALMFLRALIRETECLAKEAVDEGKLDIIHVTYLNLLSDYIFAFIWFELDFDYSEDDVWSGI